VAVDACRTTQPDEWRSQSDVNKQGSGDAISHELGEKLSQSEAEFHAASKELYANRLDSGVAREQARKDLPLSTYTEAYWKIDLHNLLHFLALRMDAHAQYEIREYAQLIGREIVSKWVPYTWEAFLEYRFNGLYLSDSETRLLSLVGQGKQAEAKQLLYEMKWLQEKEAVVKESREATEFKAKLQKMGMPLPW
jgi:thymidylate synthase (FAD)